LLSTPLLLLPLKKKDLPTKKRQQLSCKRNFFLF
jgi:hypothetical protein